MLAVLFALLESTLILSQMRDDKLVISAPRELSPVSHIEHLFEGLNPRDIR